MLTIPVLSHREQGLYEFCFLWVQKYVGLDRDTICCQLEWGISVGKRLPPKYCHLETQAPWWSFCCVLAVQIWASFTKKGFSRPKTKYVYWRFPFFLWKKVVPYHSCWLGIVILRVGKYRHMLSCVSENFSIGSSIWMIIILNSGDTLIDILSIINV